VVTESTLKHLNTVCYYFDDIFGKLEIYSVLNKVRAIANISKAIGVSRNAIYKNSILLKYIEMRNSEISNYIRKFEVTDRVFELETEIKMLSVRDVSLELSVFENDTLKEENTQLKKEIDRLKKLLSHSKS
jgi:hypothetical protein